MMDERWGAAGTYDVKHGLVASGGIRAVPWQGDPRSSILSTVEQTNDGSTFQGMTSLPLKVFGHCMVSLQGDLFMTGGFNGSTPMDQFIKGHSKATFIYRDSDQIWDTVADMPTAREGTFIKINQYVRDFNLVANYPGRSQRIRFFSLEQNFIIYRHGMWS